MRYVVKTHKPYPHSLRKVNKASRHLLKHIIDEQSKRLATSKNLLDAASDDPNDDPEPVWLILTTKRHIVDQKRLKPSKISVPHALVKQGTSICLITADPQRAYKDAIAESSFPEDLRARIRILGVKKIRQRYKSFESRRQLVAEYDTFLADDRVITSLPSLLGKTLFESSKRPIPVDLKDEKQQQVAKKGAKPRVVEPRATNSKAMANQIEKALRSARIHLSPSVTTAVHVGYSHFSADQLQQNIEAVVEGMQQKFVPQGWRNIRAIHIKGPNTVALPLWSSNQLWIDEDDVLEEKEAEEVRALESQKRKKRGQGGGERLEGQARKKAKLLGSEEGFSKEMAERREALRRQKRQLKAQLEEGDGVVAATDMPEHKRPQSLAVEAEA